MEGNRLYSRRGLSWTTWTTRRFPWPDVYYRLFSDKSNSSLSVGDATAMYRSGSVLVDEGGEDWDGFKVAKQITDIDTYSELDIMTHDPGLVIKTKNDDVFQVTIVRVR